jgi:hypothetical protein
MNRISRAMNRVASVRVLHRDDASGIERLVSGMVSRLVVAPHHDVLKNISRTYDPACIQLEAFERPIVEPLL